MSSFDLGSARAVLFDLDGTLIDSMPAHNQAWIETLAKHGCTITETILHELAGVPNEKTVALFNQRFHWALDPLEIAAEKEANVLRRLTRVGIIEPVVAVARSCAVRMIPIGVVSGGSRALVHRLLDSSKLASLFSTVVTFEDTPHGKPAPDPFLEGARRLGVEPAACLVFEDGDAGIQSAQAAGMRVVRVLSGGTLRSL